MVQPVPPARDASELLLSGRDATTEKRYIYIHCTNDLAHGYVAVYSKRRQASRQSSVPKTKS
jgi:hypothetical protein